MLVARTIKGRGVSFMEHPAALREGGGTYRWHAGAPDDESFERARDELLARLGPVELEPVPPLEEELPAPALEAEPESGAGTRVTVTREYVVEAYGEALVELAGRNPALVVLDADLASDCRVRGFEEAYPERFLECGIAEQDMVSVAGGLARHGLVPVVNSFASFLASRANEQIYNNASEGSKVIYALHYAGLIPAGPGMSHQSLRDVSLLAALPSMTIVQPANAEETKAVVEWAVEEAEGNVAIRLAIGPSPRRIELGRGYRLAPGRGTVLREGDDAVVVAYGPVMLHEVLTAAELLAEHGQHVTVVDHAVAQSLRSRVAGRADDDAGADRRRRRSRLRRCARRRPAPRATRPRGDGLRRRRLAGLRHAARGAAGTRARRRLACWTHRRSPEARRGVSATFAPELAVVLSFHGVVERIEDPDIQVNHIDLETFERIVELVEKRYDVVTIDDVAAGLRDSAALPEHAAALTFDDAYRSVLELADPLLTARGLPYAVFVPSALVDAGARVPTYVMRAALSLTEEGSVQLPGRRRAFKLRTTEERSRAITHAAELLRTLPLAESDIVLAQLHALLSEDAWNEVDARFASEELLGWPELRSLVQQGVTIGSHTRDHAVLHAGQPSGDVVDQLERSKATIEERLGTACRHFCFPHGHPRDLSRDAVEAARAAGYSTAFMNVGGPVREGMDPMLLPRIAIAGSPPDGTLADRVQLSQSKWYRRVAAELGLD